MTETIIYYRDIDHALDVSFLREIEATIDRLLKLSSSGSVSRLLWVFHL